MFQQRYGVLMQDGYQKWQPDAGRFNFQDRMGGGPGMRLSQLMTGYPMTGGNYPAMPGPTPMTGGPGQIQPMPPFNTGGRLPPMQSGYPMLGQQPLGLAAMFRGYSPYRYG